MDLKVDHVSQLGWVLTLRNCKVLDFVIILHFAYKPRGRSHWPLLGHINSKVSKIQHKIEVRNIVWTPQVYNTKEVLGKTCTYMYMYFHFTPLPSKMSPSDLWNNSFLGFATIKIISRLEDIFGCLANHYNSTGFIGILGGTEKGL